jgi:predicted HTH transcriptional regulator
LVDGGAPLPAQISPHFSREDIFAGVSEQCCLERKEDLVPSNSTERLTLHDLRLSTGKTLCAFANNIASGGVTMVFGVTDRGEIQGVNDVDAVLQFLHQLCGVVQPSLKFQEEIVPITKNGRFFVLLHVTAAVGCHSYKQKIYVRSGSSTEEATNSQVSAMHVFAADYTHNPSPSLTFQSPFFDVNVVRTFLDQCRSADGIDSSWDSHTLQSFYARSGWLKVSPLPVEPRLFALMFFLHQHLEHAFIDLTIGPADSFFRQAVTGPLFQQVASCIRALETAGVLKDEICVNAERSKHEKHPTYPRRALTEVLVNALAHRRYDFSGPVKVDAREGRVTISNPGVVPGWSLDNKASLPRNPSLLALFAKMHMAEERGTGLDRVRRYCVEAGCPAPEFRVTEDHFVAILFRRPPSPPLSPTTGGLSTDMTELRVSNNNKNSNNNQNGKHAKKPETTAAVNQQKANKSTHAPTQLPLTGAL